MEGALVLEGDSLRGMFMSEVLDMMMEQEIELSYVNGVSAGSMCGMNYLSKQAGRTLQVNTEYPHDKRYAGFWDMLKNRLVFNFDFLFGELSTELAPLDFETLESSPQRFEVMATGYRTGQSVFFEKDVYTDMYAAVQTSCNAPVLSRTITAGGRKYLDGGISLPIVYRRAMELGYGKMAVVLTRRHGYRKKPVDRLMKRGYDRYFESLPELRATLEEVPERYNRIQEGMGRLEVDGKPSIIRPEFPVMISRVEQDAERLKALYAEDRRIREERLKVLREYLEI